MAGAFGTFGDPKVQEINLLKSTKRINFCGILFL